MKISILNMFLFGTALAVAASSAISQAPAPQNAQSQSAAQQRGPQGWAATQAKQAWATEKLAKSARRNQWVKIPNGNRTLKAWVDFPDVRRKVPVVVVGHEVFGLTDSTRNTADEIAAMGYIVIAPDMLSGYGPNGGNSDSFEPPNSASQILTALRDQAVDSDLNAWADYASKLPGSNGKLAIVGLSWSGGAAFRYITTNQRKDLKLVCVFYDVGPPKATQKVPNQPATISVANISVPVYGFYGSKDTRVMASLQATKEAMAAAGKAYDPVVYEGADHAFMRVGEDPEDTNRANPVAVQASLARLKKLLGEM